MSRGHEKNAVLNEYSIPEVMLFAKTAVKNQNQELASLLMGMRMATLGKGETFEKYVNNLLGTKSRSIRKKRSSKADVNKLRQLGERRR